MSDLPKMMYGNTRVQTLKLRKDGVESEIFNLVNQNGETMYHKHSSACMVNDYHYHSGSRSGGGGCYTIYSTSGSTWQKCSGYFTVPLANGGYACNSCGHGGGSDAYGKPCSESHIVSTYDPHYELGCGLSNGQLIGWHCSKGFAKE